MPIFFSLIFLIVFFKSNFGNFQLQKFNHLELPPLTEKDDHKGGNFP